MIYAYNQYIQPGNPTSLYSFVILLSSSTSGSQFKKRYPNLFTIPVMNFKKYLRWLFTLIRQESWSWENKFLSLSLRRHTKIFCWLECPSFPNASLCVWKDSSNSKTAPWSFQHSWRGIRKTWWNWEGRYTGEDDRLSSYHVYTLRRIVFDPFFFQERTESPLRFEKFERHRYILVQWRANGSRIYLLDFLRDRKRSQLNIH